MRFLIASSANHCDEADAAWLPDLPVWVACCLASLENEHNSRGIVKSMLVLRLPTSILVSSLVDAVVAIFFMRVR
jgi:hypothetical protein